MIYAYSVVGRKDSFVLGGKVVRYLGELVFKKHIFLNM